MLSLNLVFYICLLEQFRSVVASIDISVSFKAVIVWELWC